MELMKKQNGLFSSDLGFFKPVQLYHGALEGLSPGPGIIPGMVCATSHWQFLTSALAPAAIDLCFQLTAVNDQWRELKPECSITQEHLQLPGDLPPGSWDPLHFLGCWERKPLET